jgi:hypothetical protein
MPNTSSVPQIFHEDDRSQNGQGEGNANKESKSHTDVSDTSREETNEQDSLCS